MERSDKKQLWVVLIIVFLGFVGISMPYLIFPVLFLNPEYAILSPEWSDSSRALLLGITLAAFPFGQFFGSPILGSLSDDYGRKSILAGSLLIASLFNLLSGIAIAWQNLGLLIISRLISGLMEGNIAIARAMVADIRTLSKHETFGKINAVASIGYLVGPLLGGIMTDKHLFQNLTASSPFYLTCILFFFLSLISVFVLKTKSKNENQVTKQSFVQRINLINRVNNLFLNKHLQFLMIVSTCFTLAVDIFYQFGPVYLTVKWNLGPAELILYNALLCVALAIGNGWLPEYVSSRTSNRLAIIFSMSAFAVLLIAMLYINSSLMMLLLFTLSGFMIGLAVTLLTVKISNAAPSNIQGEVMGVQVSLRVLGDALICLFGGTLLIFSSKLILIIASLISLLGMIYFAQRNHSTKSSVV